MAGRKERPKQILLTAKRIQARVAELGKRITRDYRQKRGGLVLVGVLKGCYPFLADLSRQINLPLTVDFIRASSYGDGTKSSGLVRIDFDLTQPVTNKHVIVVDDIADTRLTLQKICKHLLVQKPRSLKVCTLLNKPVRRQVPVKLDYVGFRIPNKFVVGYGLDLEGLYRNLPDIWYLK